MMDWRRLAILFFVSTVVETASFGQAQAFIPIYLREELGVSASDIPRWTGWMMSAPMFVALPLAPFWGLLADRFGRKPLILRSMVAEMVAYSLMSVAPNLETLFVSRMLIGLAVGNVAIETATLSLAAPPGRMTAAVAFLQSAFPIGHSIGPLFGGFLASAIGLRGVFLLNAVLNGLVFVMLLLTFHDRAERNAQPFSAQFVNLFRTVLGTPAVRAVFLLAFLFAAADRLADAYAPARLDELYRESGMTWLTTVAFVGLVVGLHGGLTGLLAVAVGHLADRVGRWQVLGIALVGLVLASMAMAASTTVTHFTAAFLVRAIPLSATIGILFALLAQYVPRGQRASVMALTPLPRNTAGAIAPAAGIPIAQASLSAIFVVAGVLYAIALVIVQRASARSRLEPVGSKQ